MIESLKGELLDKAPGHAVVECHGVGYLVHVSLHTWSRLPEKGSCRLLVHYAVSVDVRSGASEHRLYGFADQDERQLFRQLIEVQGVSSTIALSILSARAADELRGAILQGDEAALRGVKGIGPKLAQRIITELSGKLGSTVTTGAATGGNTLRGEALSALVSLGLDRLKAERALAAVLKEHASQTPPLEELIRLTLKNL
ncbi:MAG: Holliday junction branch migration protein RuvA [Flavobacteriales bacterium]|nr:Holliday junction branch migration protein RuvA [Flavobacteriales bacterium]